MAKSIKKSISKATKKTKKTAKSVVKEDGLWKDNIPESEVKAEVSKVTDTGTSTIRATIEENTASEEGGTTKQRSRRIRRTTA